LSKTPGDATLGPMRSLSRDFRPVLLALVGIALGWALSATGAGPESGRRSGGRKAEAARVTSDSMRVLQSNCFACHNAEKHKGGLSLTNRESLLKGGDSGKAIVPRRPEKSLLFTVLGAEADPHMPPKKQLSTNQVETVRRWIAAGARGMRRPWPAWALRGEWFSSRCRRVTGR